MTQPALHLLHIDASPRPGRAGTDAHGSLTRQLTHAFASRWRAARPADETTYRDLGAAPPTPVTGAWIAAAFTPPDALAPPQAAVLAESDALIAELRAADVVVIGLPMYNFGLPAPLKAWVDAVVRLGVTFNFDPGLPDPYIPLLAERPRRAVLLTSRGGSGFGPGGAVEAMNFADPALRTALGFIGITDVHTIAIEHQEAGGAAFDASVAQALQVVDALVDRWARQLELAPA